MVGTVEEEATVLKEEGNGYFRSGEYVRAIQCYLQAIDMDPSMVTLYTNAANAFARVGEHERAIEMSSHAIQLDPNFEKCYYRRGCSLMAMGEFQRALQDLRRVAKHCPNDQDVRSRLQECERRQFAASFQRAIHVEQFDLNEHSIGQLEVAATYEGPRLELFGVIPIEFCHALLQWYREDKRLEKRYAYHILHAAKEVLVKEPNLKHIRLPADCKLSICGDIHGQFFDLANIFALNGLPSANHAYLFNGDIVDRGAYSVECLLLLLAFKAALPDRLFIARGNHESRTVNNMHGFLQESSRKYGGDQFFHLANRVMDDLPLAHLINDRVFVVHGGLPRKPDFMLSDLESINRHSSPINGTMMAQLLWSDPKSEPGISESHRGEGILFGPDVTKAFLERNHLDLIIRSHVWEPTGYKIEHDGRCITIFSAPNYTGSPSPAALIRMNADGSEYEFFTFEAAEYQGKCSRPTTAF